MIFVWAIRYSLARIGIRPLLPFKELGVKQTALDMETSTQLLKAARVCLIGVSRDGDSFIPQPASRAYQAREGDSKGPPRTMRESGADLE